MRALPLFLLLLIASLAIGGPVVLGLRFHLGSATLGVRKDKAIGAPLGTVRLIDPSSNQARAAVELYSYHEIYRALGLTNDKLVQWEKAYGYGSKGTNPSGSLLVQGFPIFSKVAWMYIEPVDLSPQEAQLLIEECDSAANLTNDLKAKNELFAIRRLAEDSLTQSAVVRFDQP
jgi:hypothetical protein